MTPIGKHYVRREPADDCGDVVVLKGVSVEELTGGGERNLLVVASAQFGEVPAGWEEADALFSSEDFVEEYREQNDAERALLAVEAAAEAKAATVANADRISPWAYFIEPAKRARA